MALIENEIDRQLAANVDQVEAGVDPSRALLLNCSAPGGFKKNEAGTLAPAEIVFDAFPLNMPGAVVQWVTDGVDIVVEGNRATLAAAAMGERELALVKLTLAYEGVSHEREHTVQVVDVSVGGLVGSLTGQITENELHESLRSRVDLVDAFADVPGSVAARVKAETDARVAALTQEAADRKTYVQGYTYSKQGIDESLSIQANTIASAYKSYADGVGSATATAASADVRSYAYSKSASDSALSAMSTQLRSEFSSVAGVSAAYVQNYTYSKSETNSAISASESTLRSEFASVAGVSAAWVQNYAYSKSTVDSSFAAQFNSLTTNYKGYADGVGTAAAADVRTYAYSKSAVDGSFSSWAQQLRSEFQAIEGGVSAAYVQNYTYSKAEANSAIASQTSDLRSTVGGYSTTIQQHTESIDGIQGKITVKIDNNGYVTGWGLISSYNNGVPTSAFIVNAGRFAVVAPGASPKYMFSVGLVNGVSTMVVGQDGIADGAIVARTIAAGAITAEKIQVSGDQNNLIRDPKFQDLAWWGFVGAEGAGIWVAHWDGQNTRWKHGSSLYMGSTSNQYLVARTKTMPVVPGATYLVEYQIGFSGDFDGDVSIWWHTYWSNSNTLGGHGVVADTPYRFPDNSAIQYPSNSRGGRDVVATITIPNNTAVVGCQFMVLRQIRGGTAEIGGFTLTRVVDATLIGPGVVETKHLSIAKGGSINSGQWGYGAGNGFFIEGAGNGHGARMSLGNSAGRQMLCDPDNNVLQLKDATINNPVIQTAFSVWIDAIRSTGNPLNSNAVAGSGAHISNGTGSYAYNWSLGGSPQLRLKSSPGAAYASIECTGNGWHYGNLTLTIRDLGNGAIASAETEVAFQIGNYQEP